jgi:hypothetical protein
MTGAEALPIVEQMAAALDAAHRAGVIHRDFKSDNVMLLADRVAVTDFGLAGPVVGDAQHGSRAGSGAVGTLHYVAPEQLAGQAPAPQADLYALGVVMFEMVTGSLPFAGAASRGGPVAEAPRPRLELLPAELPPGWAKAITGCLQPDPGRRPASVEAIVRLLRPPPARRRWVALFASALAVGGMLAAARHWQAHRSASAPEPPVETARPSPAGPQAGAGRQPPGVLALRIDADRAEVLLDDRLVAASTRAVRFEVPSDGPHRLVVSAPGRRTFQREIRVAPGTVIELAVHLPLRPSATEPAPPAQKPESDPRTTPAATDPSRSRSAPDIADHLPPLLPPSRLPPLLPPSGSPPRSDHPRPP